MMLSNYGAREDSWESLGQQQRSNQSILKEINPEYSLEGLMLMMKLKLQYFGLVQRVDSLVNILMLGKAEGKRKKGQKRMRWLDSIVGSLDMSVSKHQEIVEDRGALCATVLKVARYRLQRVRQDLATEQQQQEQLICVSLTLMCIPKLWEWQGYFCFIQWYQFCMRTL